MHTYFYGLKSPFHACTQNLKHWWKENENPSRDRYEMLHFWSGALCWLAVDFLSSLVVERGSEFTARPRNKNGNRGRWRREREKKNSLALHAFLTCPPIRPSCNTRAGVACTCPAGRVSTVRATKSVRTHARTKKPPRETGKKRQGRFFPLRERSNKFFLVVVGQWISHSCSSSVWPTVYNRPRHHSHALYYLSSHQSILASLKFHASY